MQVKCRDSATCGPCGVSGFSFFLFHGLDHNILWHKSVELTIWALQQNPPSTCRKCYCRGLIFRFLWWLIDGVVGCLAYIALTILADVIYSAVATPRWWGKWFTLCWISALVILYLFAVAGPPFIYLFRQAFLWWMRCRPVYNFESARTRVGQETWDRYCGGSQPLARAGRMQKRQGEAGDTKQREWRFSALEKLTARHPKKKGRAIANERIQARYRGLPRGTGRSAI